MKYTLRKRLDAVANTVNGEEIRIQEMQRLCAKMTTEELLEIVDGAITEQRLDEILDRVKTL